MLERLGDKLCALLCARGIPACAGYPEGPGGAGEAVYLCLSRAETPEGGRPRYLGLREAPGEAPREVYGLRCRVVLALEVRVPLETAEAARTALALLQRTAEALGEASMHLERLQREEPTVNRAAGALRLRGSAEGSLLLLFDEPEGDEPLFGDFVLRGELTT